MPRRDAAVVALPDAWKSEASQLERKARGEPFSDIERRLMNMHARVLRACADQLQQALWEAP